MATESGLIILRRKRSDGKYDIYPDYHLQRNEVLHRATTVSLSVLLKRQQEVLGYTWIDITDNGRSLKDIYDNAVPVLMIRKDREHQLYFDGTSYIERRPDTGYYPAIGADSTEDHEASLAEWRKSYKALLSIKMPVDSHYMIKKAAMTRLMHLMSVHNERFPILGAEQQYWCLEASHGGLRYADNGFSGKCFEYDVSSCYPALMMKARFPCGAPEFRTLTSVTEQGIYRLLNFKGCVYYDVLRPGDTDARLAMDGKPNALIWPDSIDGRELFSSYITPLYDLKRKGHNLAKRYLNIVTGALATKRWQPVDDIKGQRFVETRQVGSGEGIQLAVSYNSIYRYPQHAHLHAFLTAYGRWEIRKITDGLGDAVKYIHTDGFLSTVEIDLSVYNKGIPAGGLGELRLEGSGRYGIHSSRKFREIDYDDTQYRVSKSGHVFVQRDGEWIPETEAGLIAKLPSF